MFMESYRTEAERRAARNYSPLRMLGAVLCYELLSGMSENLVTGLAAGAVGMAVLGGAMNSATGTGVGTATAAGVPMAPRAQPTHLAPSLGLSLAPKFNMGGMDWGS